MLRDERPFECTFLFDESFPFLLAKLAEGSGLETDPARLHFRARLIDLTFDPTRLDSASCLPSFHSIPTTPTLRP